MYQPSVRDGNAVYDALKAVTGVMTSKEFGRFMGRLEHHLHWPKGAAGKSLALYVEWITGQPTEDIVVKGSAHHIM